MKIKFNSDNELPLKKTIEIPSITVVAVVVRAVFYENNKYYPQLNNINIINILLLY